MTSPRQVQFNDISSPGFRDTNPPRPPRISFRSSVGLIPTPGTVSKRHPTYEPVLLRYWVVSLGCALLAALGIALEIVRKVSINNNGFHVPEKNVFSFTSAQFLTSFFPALIFVPLALMVHGFDWSIRLWHPYLILSRGNAAADETLLVDYVGYFPPSNVQTHAYSRIWVDGDGGIAVSTTSRIHLLRQTVFANHVAASVQSTRAIGLNPNIADLSAFAASAGFAESAVYNRLGDPPFVLGGWATAEFVFLSDPYLNGTMTVNTTGIQTNANCAVPNQASVTLSNTDASTVSATSIDGCSLQLTFTASAAPQQYGVVNVPNCGVNTAGPAFQPVFFWFWQQNPNRFAGVFCQPLITLFDVTASAFLSNNSLANVTRVDNYPKANNVSGLPLNGVPYNGLIFDTSTNTNVQSRANAIRSGIPNAIYRQAEQAPGGPDSVFQDPNGFLTLTRQVYTRHLSLATTSNYFISTNQTVPAVLTRLVPRLFIESLPAHFLAFLCVAVAAVTFGLHTWHYRQRRDIFLAHEPGSIGSAVALTSHSGFGELLMPYDDSAALSRALASLRFCLDRRTGAIVVDDSAVSDAEQLSARGVRDETMMTLMGNGQRHQREDSSGAETPPGS
ncbi:hypothetical protein BJV78DRAFT_1133260 [Lactifluus subvellereus]|nr:hypothetical protein BJV78DRAFT_1133260 [Lactifluus subvellereus]